MKESEKGRREKRAPAKLTTSWSRYMCGPNILSMGHSFMFSLRVPRPDFFERELPSTNSGFYLLQDDCIYKYVYIYIQIYCIYYKHIYIINMYIYIYHDGFTLDTGTLAASQPLRSAPSQGFHLVCQKLYTSHHIRHGGLQPPAVGKATVNTYMHDRCHLAPQRSSGRSCSKTTRPDQ